MNKLTFNISTTADFLQKLREDYDEYRKDKTSSRVALNCAMTAWRLTEWCYNEYFKQLAPQFSTLSFYQHQLKRECSSLQIMHDLANGTKHYRLTRHKPIVKESILHNGGFSKGFSRGFNTSKLDIALNDGTKIYFEDEIETTMNFWIQYLKSNFNLTT